MSTDAVITLIIIGLMLLALVKDILPADVATFGALGTLLLLGIVKPEDAAKGFGNKGMLTVAVLFPVAYAAQTSGMLDNFAATILGKAKNGGRSLMRVMLPVFGLSSFLNNTPVVAMFIPTVRDWAVKGKISPSKFLLPVSYASIFGGVCTLIGTSTNLVANGMFISSKGMSLKMFDFAYIGIPCAIAGFLFLMLIGRRILPDNQDLLSDFTSSGSKYLFEMKVNGGGLAGKTISDGKLRNLNEIYVTGIGRDGKMITPVKPDEIIMENDTLFFSGLKDSMTILSKISGLIPANGEDHYNQLIHRSSLKVVEAVVSMSSTVLGKKIKDVNFRGKFDAVVLAISRSGEMINASIGNTTLKAGDTLLLLTGSDFFKRTEGSRDFYMMSKPETISPLNKKKMYISLVTILGMIVLSATGTLDIFIGSIIALVILLFTKTITATEARRSVELNVLIVIASSLGLGIALEKTGAAAYIAGGIIGMTENLGIVGSLAAVMLATTVLTEMITNNAAVALIFPIAMSVADKAGVSPIPFALATAISASASFATPIGYQTNLMVYGPGGYKFTDFLKVGLPLNIIFYIVSLITIPLVFKF